MRWLHGLVAAIIGGAASGVTAGFAAIGIAPNQFNLQAGLRHTFALAGACALVGAVQTVAAYLKNFPDPWSGEERRSANSQ